MLFVSSINYHVNLRTFFMFFNVCWFVSKIDKNYCGDSTCHEIKLIKNSSISNALIDVLCRATKSGNDKTQKLSCVHLQYTRDLSALYSAIYVHMLKNIISLGVISYFMNNKITQYSISDYQIYICIHGLYI